MDDDIQAFGIKLGRHALSRDWSGVYQMLAPWLQSRFSVEDVRAFFEEAYRDMLRGNGIQELHYPEYPDPEVGGNAFTNATELRKPISFKQGKVRAIPAELTDTNFRYWLKLQLQCSDKQMEHLGFDSLAEIWMAVVTTPDGLRVGYWNQDPYGVSD